MRILVPVDGSENSMHAVEFIASRTTLLGSNPEIEVLNIQLPLPARACRLVGQDSLTRYYEDEAAKVFEPVRTALNKVGLPGERSLPRRRSLRQHRSRSREIRRRPDRHGLPAARPLFAASSSVPSQTASWPSPSARF